MSWLGIADGVLGMVDGVLDKVIPDAAEREKAKLELLKLQQSGQLKDLEARMSAILAEAKSEDPWTSRARPSFLYVIYILLLAAIPMGFVHAYDPTLAANVSAGFAGWLNAIPSELYTLFGVGYLGYTGARSWQKAKLK